MQSDFGGRILTALQLQAHKKMEEATVTELYNAVSTAAMEQVYHLHLA